MIVVITSWAPTAAFRKPAIAGPERARERGGADAEQDVRGRGHAAEATPDPARDEEPHEVLALAADVEEAAAEGEGDREPGQDQRRRLEERLGEVVGRGLGRVGRHGCKNQSRPAPLKMSR